MSEPVKIERKKDRVIQPNVDPFVTSLKQIEWAEIRLLSQEQSDLTHHCLSVF